MTKKTPLYEQHCQAGGTMVDFAGWDMPLHYGSQLEEHQQVRQSAGMFDVSHMVTIDISGTGARDFLRKVIANDVDRLAEYGKALYGVMLNEQAGVIDDLIIYHCAEDSYRLVVNAATREKNLAWLTQHAEKYLVTLQERSDLSMIAVQGPKARELTNNVLAQMVPALKTEGLKPFHAVSCDDWFVARTGYTGEDGFEIILRNEQAINFWQALLAEGIKPCGLGARDTLRLEAGLNLYGTDMDEETNPLEANLGWTIAWEPSDRRFIGREVLDESRHKGVAQKLVGLVLQERGVLRNHQKVVVDEIGEGEITSGSFSPTIGRSIALARVPIATGDSCTVEVRGKLMTAKVVKPPFVRHGKILV